MTEIRPTWEILKSLPRESFDDPSFYDHIRGLAGRSQQDKLSALQKIDLREVQHDLIRDGKERFAEGGFPDRHESSSAALGRPVFEVRSRKNGALRGALVEEYGVYWLVYADKHDRFHSLAAKRFSQSDDSWGPRPIDLKLLEQDRQRSALEARDSRIVSSLHEAMKRAVREVGERIYSKGSIEAGCDYCLTVCVDPTDYLEDPDCLPHLVEVELRVDPRFDEIRKAILRLLYGLLDPDPQMTDQVYGCDYQTLHISMVVSEKRLALIASDKPNSKTVVGMGERPLVYHWAPSDWPLQTLVLGRAVRALCGVEYFPLNAADDTNQAELPICPECERIYPLAAEISARFRSSYS